jgi:hypothetical protein
MKNNEKWQMENEKWQMVPNVNVQDRTSNVQRPASNVQRGTKPLIFRHPQGQFARFDWAGIIFRDRSIRVFGES